MVSALTNSLVNLVGFFKVLMRSHTRDCSDWGLAELGFEIPSCLAPGPDQGTAKSVGRRHVMISSLKSFTSIPFPLHDQQKNSAHSLPILFFLYSFSYIFIFSYLYSNIFNHSHIFFNVLHVVCCTLGFVGCKRNCSERTQLFWLPSGATEFQGRKRLRKEVNQAPRAEAEEVIGIL